MATSYTATTVGKPTAPAYFDTDAKNATGMLTTMIGWGSGAVDGGAPTQTPQAIGGAALAVKADTDGNTNTP